MEVTSAIALYFDPKGKALLCDRMVSLANAEQLFHIVSRLATLSFAWPLFIGLGDPIPSSWSPRPHLD